MELTVRIVSVSELKESTFTTRQGETKLLSKRLFIINDGYDEIACEMLGDKAKTYATPLSCRPSMAVLCWYSSRRKGVHYSLQRSNL